MLRTQVKHESLKNYQKPKLIFEGKILRGIFGLKAESDNKWKKKAIAEINNLIVNLI